MFCFRLEHLVTAGVFALIYGKPGFGELKILQLLDKRLNFRNDVVVGVMERPQSSLNDFYRESITEIRLTPSVFSN